MLKRFRASIFLTAIYICILPAQIVLAQTTELDSLKRAIGENRKADTSKVDQLNQMAYKSYTYDVETLGKYSKLALDLSRKLNYPKGEGMAYKNLALRFMLMHGDGTALTYLNRALKIFISIKDRVNTASTYNAFGNYYARLNDHSQAYAYFSKALLVLNHSNKYQEMITTIIWGIILKICGSTIRPFIIIPKHWTCACQKKL